MQNKQKIQNPIHGNHDELAIQEVSQTTSLRRHMSHIPIVIECFLSQCRPFK